MIIEINSLAAKKKDFTMNIIYIYNNKRDDYIVCGVRLV